MSWRIFPPSVGEFAEMSGKLTMRDGQSAAVVIIQVSIQWFSVTPLVLCVCWRGWSEVVGIPEFVVVVDIMYFSLNVIEPTVDGSFCASLGFE